MGRRSICTAKQKAEVVLSVLSKQKWLRRLLVLGTELSGQGPVSLALQHEGDGWANGSGLATALAETATEVTRSLRHPLAARDASIQRLARRDGVPVCPRHSGLR